MLGNKVERASIILRHIFDLEASHGQPVPAAPDGRKMARLVELDQWNARITRGHRKAFAPVYAAGGTKPAVDFAERWVTDRHWTAVELKAGQREVLIANVRGDEIDLFRFIPGSWEAALGAHNGGDEIAYDRVIYPRPGSDELRELLESADAQLPPLRIGPPLNDELRSPSMRPPSRRKQWPGEHAKFPPLH